MIKTLNIDIESFSSVDIKKSGLYKYVQSPDFEVLLFAYSVNGGATEIIDLAQGEEIPVKIIKAMLDANVTKYAYNAAFEWYCLSKHLGVFHSNDWLNHWHDTMLHGLYCGFTAGLEATAKAVGLSRDKQKMTVGRSLIKLFCTPTKPTKKNGSRTRTLPHHEPYKWDLFKEYCIQDVEVEKAIQQKLARFPVPEQEQKLWELDQRINAFGVNVDKELIDSAIYIDKLVTNELKNEAVKLTGLNNPNSTAQLKKWLAEQLSLINI